MSKLLLSKSTSRQLGLILKHPPHAILICGQPGSGKYALGEEIASLLLGTTVEKLPNQPHFITIKKPEGKQEIPIDLIREVIRRLKLKPPQNDGQATRAVLIEDAHLLSHEAQNALLKALEEPPAGTVFILLALSETSVLPTIASRSQKIKIGTISAEDALEYFKKNYDEQAIKSAWQLSGGAIGLLNALLNEDEGHALKIAVENAKKVLKSSRYDRALFLDSSSASKAEFLLVLDALGRILAALHRSAVASQNTKSAGKLITARQQVDAALTSLEKNTSAKLVAMDLALNLTV